MINIKNKEQLEEFIWKNKDKVVVIYFGSNFCNPCKTLKNKLTSVEVISTMRNLVVGYVDINSKENQDICELYKISSIPVQSFVTLKGTQIVEIKRIIGYDWINFTMTYDIIINDMSNKNDTENIENMMDNFTL